MFTSYIDTASNRLYYNSNFSKPDNESSNGKHNTQIDISESHNMKDSYSKGRALEMSKLLI